MQKGEIPVFHLQRYWSKVMSMLNGSEDLWKDEANLDRALLDCLGLGLEPTIMHLFQNRPTFPAFEAWIGTQTNLKERAAYFDRYNRLFESFTVPECLEVSPPLSKEMLDSFQQHGYLVIPQAISREACEETVRLITDHLHIDLTDPATWYENHDSRQGIMVQLFRHPLLESNRHSPGIKQAYECLWNSRNLWVSTDRVGFNPPETRTWKFPGPHLHLDVVPQLPLPFGLQGILYLTDTAANQGALTVVPGFHQQIDQWISQFEAGKAPMQGVFDHLEQRPIPANAGDFIIWHHGLPHGSSPNRHTRPRIVQYINWYKVR